MPFNTVELFRHTSLQLCSCIKEITVKMAGLLTETCWWRYYSKFTSI